MRRCPNCEAEATEDAEVCEICGSDLSPSTPSPAPFHDADLDPESRRKKFERRYGIDIGDRTVEEYLEHLHQQDYSRSVWLGLLVVAELLGVGFFTVSVLGAGGAVFAPHVIFPVISGTLALSILGDTHSIGQFEPRSKIRWVYVLLSAIPLVGHIAALFYLVLRRLMYEQITKHRRQLFDAGFDVTTNSGNR